MPYVDILNVPDIKIMTLHSERDPILYPIDESLRINVEHMIILNSHINYKDNLLLDILCTSTKGQDSTYHNNLSAILKHWFSTNREASLRDKCYSS